MKKLAIGAFALCIAGCGNDNAMTQAEMDAAKHSKPPTAEQMKVMSQGMAAGFQKMKDSQSNWAKANPEKAAQVNAARAKAGMPPLGG